MNKHKLILVLAAMLTLSACEQIPAGSQEQAALATAVAATLASAPQEDTASATATSGATPKAQPTATFEPQTLPVITTQDFLLGFTDAGNLWTLSSDGSTNQLTNSGEVVDVLLSNDRQRIVYIRQSFQSELFEVRAINADGTNDQQILSQETLDALYPLNGALHYLTSQMKFIPGTHMLLFNTRATFDGPGLVKNDDLYRLNVDTGEMTQLIARESGGDFSISPDGSMLALSQADSISMAAIDGTNLRPDLVTFPPIITYSEYQYYPIPVWAPDSSGFGVFIPSQDPLADDPNGTVWVVPTGADPRAFEPIAGQIFFPQSNGGSLLSPDLQTVAFLRQDDQGQADQLFLSDLDGTNSRLYDQGDIQWIGWNPDGSRFAFRKNQTSLVFGSPQNNPQPLAEGRSLQWLSAEIFSVQAGQRGDWTLILGHMDGTTKMLVQPSGESLAYDIK